MEHGSLFVEISLIIALAAVVSAFMRLLKQPLLIGYVITGIIVGPLLGLIQSPEALEGLSKVGIALLLFIVGLGINPKVLKELGPVAVAAGVTQVVASTIVGTTVMLLIGRSLSEGLIVGGALAFSSTIVGLKIVGDKKELSRLYGRIAIGVMLVQDVLAILALVVLSAQSQGFSFSSTSQLILKGLVVSIPIIIISNKLLSKATRFISSNQEFLFLSAIAWGFGIASLYDWAGFSLEIGALIAGVSLASMPYAQEVSARMRPVRDFFIIIFFIFLGVNLEIGEMIRMLPMAALFSLFVLIANPIAIMIPMGILGHTKRNSFKVGVMMAQIGEFSMIFVLLANQIGIVDRSLLSMITMVSLLTIAISCYMMIYDNQLFKFMQKFFTFFESKHPEKHESTLSYDVILLGYKKGGSELIKSIRKLKGKKVLVVDYDPDVVDQLERQKLNHVYGDATDIELLEEINLASAKMVITTITDHPTNKFLIQYISENNPKATTLLHADNPHEAAELYNLGASYIMIPHHVGGEKIAHFIERHGLKKSEFEKYRERHINELARMI